MAKDLKVKLDLLKKTVAELEAQLRTAQTIREAMTTPDETMSMEFIIQMNKVSGLVRGVINEATYLSNDVDRETQIVQAGSPNMDKLMEALGEAKMSKGYGGFGNGGFGGGGLDN